MLTSAGRLYIGSVIAPALGSAALSLPAEATPAPHPNISEEQTEVTAEKVVGQQPASELREPRVLRHPYVQVH